MLSGSRSWKSCFGCKHRHQSLTRSCGAGRSPQSTTALWSLESAYSRQRVVKVSHDDFLNLSLLTDCCITGIHSHLSLHLFNGHIQSSTLRRFILFFPNEHSSSLNCAVCPIPFCERAGPHIGTIHELLRRATSLCSETAINDKQETLKMSHGEDEKKTAFLCRSRKQTFLVVPHIKPPLTQMLTHRYKQDLIRIGTRVDAFRIYLLM